MTQVTIPPSLGGSGIVYSDDGGGARDMRNGGFRANLLPMVSETISAAGVAVAAATSTLGGAAVQGTSTTSLTIGVGTQSLTVQTGKSYQVGMPVRIANSATNWMDGLVTSYNSGTGALVVSVDRVAGSGILASWSVFLTGRAGAGGVPYLARTSNTQITAANNGFWIDITSGTFTQTFETAANLGANFFCYVSNNGAGEITVTSDGVTNWIMWPGEFRLFHSDGTTLRSTPFRSGRAVLTTTRTILAPPNMNIMDAIIVGASGGGGGGAQGGGATGGFFGGGGGSGAHGGYGRVKRIRRRVTSGESLAATIGAGGSAGTAGSGAGSNVDGNIGTAGGAGGATLFDGITADGGVGGARGNGGLSSGNGSTGGAGGTAVSAPADATVTGANRMAFFSLAFAGVAGAAGTNGSSTAGLGGTAPAATALPLTVGVTYTPASGGNGGNGSTGAGAGLTGVAGTVGVNGVVVVEFSP